MLRDPFEVVIILYNISPSGIIKLDLALLQLKVFNQRILILICKQFWIS